MTQLNPRWLEAVQQASVDAAAADADETRLGVPARQRHAPRGYAVESRKTNHSKSAKRSAVSWPYVGFSELLDRVGVSATSAGGGALPRWVGMNSGPPTLGSRASTVSGSGAATPLSWETPSAMPMTAYRGPSD